MTTKRTIKLKLLTQTELVKVETSARTLGELKEEITELGIDWSSSKLIDRASKASFEVDQAVLPEIDSVMFVMPTKSKAGALGYWEARDAVKEYKDNGGDVPFNYTHKTTQELNEFLDTIEKNNNQAEEVDEIHLYPGTYILKVMSNETEPKATNKVKLLDETTEDDIDFEAQQLLNLF